MKAIAKLLSAILFLLLFFSCENTSEYRARLDKAEELLEEYPDSAFNVLDLIVSPEFLEEKDFHRYTLLQVQSKHKTRRDISKDTTLFNIRGYYDNLDLEKAAIVYLYSGAIHKSQKKYEDALKDYLNAERMAVNLESNLKAKIQHFIGSLFFLKKEFDESKLRLLLALQDYEQCEDFKNMISIYNMMGTCYTLENKLDSAQFYFQNCIKLLENVDDYLHKALVLNNLSGGYRALGNIEKAKGLLYEALSYPIIDREQSKITHNLARINIRDKDSFYYYMDKSFELIKDDKENLEHKSNLYLSYSKFEESQGAYDLALEHHKNYVYYLQDAHKKDYESSLNLLQHRFYLKGFEQENMRLLIRSQRLYLVGTIFVILLLLAIVYIFRQKKSLEDAEKNVEYLKKMSELYNEKERNMKNIILQNFNILKKVAGLEQYMVTNPSSNKLLKKFNEIVYNQDSMNWEQLYETMNSLHNNLFVKLKNDFPNLDETEFRICCLTVGKFSNLEMGIIMKYSPNTIQSKKATIRKKIGVKPMGNIGDFLYNYYSDKNNVV